MQFCQNCGTRLSDGTRFCNVCGAPQQNGQPANNVPHHQPVVYMNSKIPGRGFGITSMVLGIIGLVLAVGFLGNVIDYIEYINSISYFSFRADPSILIFLVYSVLSILSLCFAPAAFRRGYKNGVSISGLIMGAIGIVIYVVSLILVLVNM